MQIVKSYKTSDGKIFEEKGEAENHEFFLNMRGILQSATTPGTTPTINDMVAGLVKNQEKLSALLSKRKREIAAAAKIAG